MRVDERRPHQYRAGWEPLYVRRLRRRLWWLELEGGVSRGADPGERRAVPRGTGRGHARHRRDPGPLAQSGCRLVAHQRVDWNASSVRASRRPPSTQCPSAAEGRLTSDRPSRAWSTMVVAVMSAGTDERPRPLGNKSPNSWPGNTARRCSARRREPPLRAGAGIAPTRRGAGDQAGTNLASLIRPRSRQKSRAPSGGLLSRLLMPPTSARCQCGEAHYEFEPGA